MSITVSEYIVNTLRALQVDTVFGVISIHNLPIADEIGRRDDIEFVPARGEAGSTAMADSFGRLRGLGVSLTSTGAGAGNAVGALLEALNAGSPLLHITGEVESPYLNKITGFIHETKDQQGFLTAACKSAYCIYRADEIERVLQSAIEAATTAPKGPVSITIPIDLQLMKFTPRLTPEALVSHINLDTANINTDSAGLAHATNSLVDELASSRNPVIWVGGGAKHCAAEIKQLADLGIPVVSSTHGRGILPDEHPRSFCAHHNHPDVISYLTNSTLMLVIGSKLRSNETASFTTPLGQKRIQIDLSPDAALRNYPMDKLFLFDAKILLISAIKRIQEKQHSWIDANNDAKILQAKTQAISDLTHNVGNYAALNHAIEQYLGDTGLFVRDITISGSTWGSRLLKRTHPSTNIHSLAGAIGLGLPHAIGACAAKPTHRTVAIVGDGGLMLNVGELGTIKQENMNLCLIIMNDGGYGVMRGIQAKYFENRQYYNELYTPDFTVIAEAYDIPRFKLNTKDDLGSVFKQISEITGPVIIEVMMSTFGELKFSGPPQKKLY